MASGEGPWITYSLVSALDVGDLGEEGEGSPLENDGPLPKQERKGYYLVENPFFFFLPSLELFRMNVSFLKSP